MPKVKLLKVYTIDRYNEDSGYSSECKEYEEYTKCEVIDDKKLDLLIQAVSHHNSDENEEYKLCLLVEADAPQELIQPTIDSYLKHEKDRARQRKLEEEKRLAARSEQVKKLEEKKKARELKKLKELAAKFGKTI